MRRKLTGIERAVAFLGTQTLMAAHLGTSQGRISNWVRAGYVPADRAQEVAALTGVPLADLLQPEKPPSQRELARRRRAARATQAVGRAQGPAS